MKPKKDKPITPIINMASKGIQNLKAAMLGRKQDKK